MKRVWLVPINPQRADVIDLRGDRKMRDLPGNACCLRWREMGERVNMLDLGMTAIRVNFCPTCGRKLR